MPDHIFISHSTKDDGLVQALSKSLKIQQLTTRIVSRELASYDKLQPDT